MKRFITIIFIINLTINLVSQTNTNQSIPVSTQWTIDASGSAGRNSIPYVFLIVCPKLDIKGTGFQLKTGEIITCAHVVGNSRADDVLAISPYNAIVRFKKVITDTNRDLAILVPSKLLSGGFLLGNEDSLKIGNIVSTWGFPEGHNGPSPLLSVGYLSGFKSYQVDSLKKDSIKHLVVNGAFNSGNSGGPLFAQNSDKVVGIVVSKMIPLLSDLDVSAIDALSKNPNGAIFNRNFPDGRTEKMAESQVVAMLLRSYQKLTQVMIGEAISVSILKMFLKEHKIKY